MKFIIHILALAFACLISIGSGFSQDCYEIIADKSGLDVESYQSELEAAACELIQSFPAEFQDSFKVYSFGFYSQHEFMELDFNEVWGKVISEIQSPYYLVFGKQSDQNGIYTKFWVRLKLPTTNEFSCFDFDFYKKIEFKVAQKTKSIYALNQNKFNTFSDAEIEGIEELKEWILKIIECCDAELRSEFSCSVCSWSTEESFEFFALKDFEQDTIIINDTLPLIDSLCLCSTEYNQIVETRQGISYEVVKSTLLSEFFFNEDTIDLILMFNELEELASEYERNNFNFFGAISDNSAFCSHNDETASRISSNLSLEEIELSFNSAQIGIWIHIQYDNSTALLNVKTRGIGGNIMENCNDYPQYCQSLSCIMTKLNANKKGFFVSEVVNTFCSQNEVDLVYKLGGTEPNNWGSTSLLSTVLKSKIVTVKLNPSQLFHTDKFCNKDSLRYLVAAETILHESVHAILVRLVAKVGQREKVTFFNYGQRYLNYKSKLQSGEPVYLALFYTEHSIILDYYFDKIVTDLRTFNDNYLTNDHYKYRVWSFGYHPPDYTIQKITGKTAQDLYWNYYIKLKEKPAFPCCPK